MSLIIKLDKGISIDTNLKDKLKNIVSLIFYDEGKGDNEINLRILDDNKMKKLNHQFRKRTRQLMSFRFQAMIYQ